MATRLAVDRALGAADLLPRSLSPAAILVVRTLRDPRPRGLVLSGRPLLAREWEAAVAAELEALARAAARPAAGAVPAHALAVLFADRAELLACLGRDWLAGSVHSRWWWRVLLPAAEPQRAVVAAWLEAPEYVPAAVARLADSGAAPAFAAALAPAEAVALTDAVARAFGLAELVVSPIEPTVVVADDEGADVAEPPVTAQAGEPAAIAEPAMRVTRAREEPLRPPGEGRPQAAPAPSPARVPSRRRDVEPPAPWAPQCAETLALPASAPAQRRFLALALALRRSASATRAPAFARELAQFVAAADEPPAPAPRGAEAVAPIGAPAADRRPAEPPQRDEHGDELLPRSEQVAPTAPAAPVEPTATPPAPVPRRTVEAVVAPVDEPVAPPEQRRDEARAERTPPDALRKPRPIGRATRTRYGGVFFLLNVAVDLGLYGDFTQPDAPGIPLDPWDFLTLVAAELLEAPEEDALWPLLAALAGRDEGMPPGRGFDPEPSLEDWTRATAAAVGERLANVSLEPEPVLVRDAAVHTTDAHVDVVFALSEHPIEIRIACLDRDPGWIPAAGRHVAFHFE